MRDANAHRIYLADADRRAGLRALCRPAAHTDARAVRQTDIALTERSRVRMQRILCHARKHRRQFASPRRYRQRDISSVRERKRTRQLTPQTQLGNKAVLPRPRAVVGAEPPAFLRYCLRKTRRQIFQHVSERAHLLLPRRFPSEPFFLYTPILCPCTGLYAACGAIIGISRVQPCKHKIL